MELEIVKELKTLQCKYAPLRQEGGAPGGSTNLGTYAVICISLWRLSGGRTDLFHLGLIATYTVQHSATLVSSVGRTIQSR